MKRKRETRQACHARGYTLVELATTLSIAAVLAAGALPVFGTLVLDTRRATAVNDLLLTFRLARSEADKRQRNVVVCGVRDADGDGVLGPAERVCSGSDWSFGWMLSLWDDGNADGVVGSGEFQVLRVFETEAAGRMTVTAGHFAGSALPSGTMLFKHAGRRASNGTVTFCDRRGPRGARAVIFSSAGRARSSAVRADGSALACPPAAGT